MAWGYEKSFTIEHDNTLKKRIDCKDCIYYDSNDKSCTKRPLYLPVDGYNSWKTCKYFELDQTVSHYKEKNVQYLHQLEKRKKQEEQKKAAVQSQTTVQSKSKKGTEQVNVEKQKKQQKTTSEIKKKSLIVQLHAEKSETEDYKQTLKNVDMKCEIFADDVQNNLCVLALEKRLHIYPIIDECEWIIQNDVKTQKGLRKEIDNSLILLAMVLDKLAYSFQDVISVPTEIEKRALRKLLKQGLKDTSPVGVSASKNEIGEDDICLKFGLYNYFINLGNDKKTRNEVHIRKVLKSNYEYVYVVDLYLTAIGIEDKKIADRELKYGYPSYHICMGRGDENSRMGKLFEKVYSKIDKSDIVRR